MGTFAQAANMADNCTFEQGLKIMETKVLLVITHDKPLPEITDAVSNRVYSLDGVRDTAAILVEDIKQDPVISPRDSMDELIIRFNKMYGLDCPGVPTLRFKSRDESVVALTLFANILAEELEEHRQIIESLNGGQKPVNILADIADWLVDIIIYCASELAKYGLRVEDIFRIIMASNASKLDLNGRPIIDERGKVMKGPNYWKPEPMICRLIEAELRQAEKRKT
jgi:hypothetical protein